MRKKTKLKYKPYVISIILIFVTPNKLSLQWTNERMEIEELLIGPKIVN